MKKPGGKHKLVTMRDVAKASGFSPATVSIVLNNAPLARYIAATTRQRIEETAKRLGYHLNVIDRTEPAGERMTPYESESQLIS